MFKEKSPNADQRRDDGLLGGPGDEVIQRCRSCAPTTSWPRYHGEADSFIKRRELRGSALRARPGASPPSELEAAAEPFEEALGHGQAPDGDMWETVPSFYRKNIQQDMAEKAYAAWQATAIEREEPPPRLPHVEDGLRASTRATRT